MDNYIIVVVFVSSLCQFNKILLMSKLGDIIRFVSFPPLETNSENQNLWISAEIYRFVRAFQNIEVTIKSSSGSASLLRVHAPYMLRSIQLIDVPENFHNLQEHHQARLLNVKAARESASPPIQALLEKHFYDDRGQEKDLARGRAELNNIRTLLQEAVDLGLMPSRRDGLPPDRFDLRMWLKTYGIGVDCSGFVQQTIQYLLNGLRADSQAPRHLPFLRCPWVYRLLAGDHQTPSPTFTRILLPSEAKPGDILVNRGHMRIVAQTENAAEDGIIFHLAESTSASDTPAGGMVEENDIGPRIIQVKYPQRKVPISKQLPLWKKESEIAYRQDENESTYFIGRYDYFLPA
jgi:hypothetical protein